MTLDLGHTFEGDALPQNLAAVLIKRVNLPGVFGIVLHRSHVTVKAVARFVFSAAGNSGGNEYFVSPNHRTRVCKTRYRCFPARVERLLGVELHSCRLSFDNSGRPRPAKLRPVLRRRRSA